MSEEFLDYSHHGSPCRLAMVDPESIHILSNSPFFSKLSSFIFESRRDENEIEDEIEEEVEEENTKYKNKNKA